MEKLFYQNNVRPALCKMQGMLFDRVENSVACGMPDIAYSYGGHHGWIELKVGLSKPDAKKVERLHLPTLRGVQSNWLRTHARAGGGHVFCLADVEDRVFLLRGEDVEGLSYKKLTSVEDVCLMRWGKETSSDIVARILAKFL